MHIFNYTNTERFLRGEDQKLKVKDVGPYVYTERTKKVNVVYNDNNTISYQVHNYRICLHVYMPFDLSLDRNYVVESICFFEDQHSIVVSHQNVVVFFLFVCLGISII